MNPLIGMMSRQAMGNMPQAQMLKQFEQFRRQLGDRNPQSVINSMMQQGQINGQQLEQAKAMAQQMMGILKR